MSWWVFIFFSGTDNERLAPMYNPETQERGPVPWQMMFSADIAYFVCMGMAGSMRPAAPSVCVEFTLASDDDYDVHHYQVTPSSPA